MKLMPNRIPALIFCLPVIVLIAGCAPPESDAVAATDAPEVSIPQPTVETVTLDPERPTVLITGSNRGLGFGFASLYAQEGWNVIATARKPEQADELKALAADFANVVIEPLDVTDEAGIDALAARYADQPIDVLINNAAVLGDLPGQKVGGLDHDLFRLVMDVNVYGPLRVSQAFAEHVAASDQKKIVTLTSGLGSLAIMGEMSGFYYYRMSKAAINMGMIGLNRDLRDRGVQARLISPGMVDTGLLAESGYRGDSLTPEQSAGDLMKIIAGLEPSKNQKPINVDGQRLPW